MAHHAKRWGVALLVAVLTVWGLGSQPKLAAAAPTAQDDPATQCAEGVQLFLEGRHEEALPLLEAGYAGRKGASFDDPRLLGLCALALGYILDDVGDPVRALEANTVALETFQASDELLLEGTAYNNIGDIYHDQGRFEDALNAYQQALDIWEALESALGTGGTLNNIAGVYRRQGRYPEALDTYDHAIAASRVAKHDAGVAAALIGMGTVYVFQGRYEDALEVYQQALTLSVQAEYLAGAAGARSGIGSVHKHRGQYAEALEAYQEALALRQDGRDKKGEGTALEDMAEVYSLQGRFEEALRTYDQALTIARQVNNRFGEASALNGIGFVHAEQGQYGIGLDYYQLALAVARAAGDQSSMGSSLNNIGSVYEAQGRHVEALQLFEESLAIARDSGDQAGQGMYVNNIGVNHVHQGRYEQALAAYESALDLARSMEIRWAEGETLGNVALVYEHLGRPEDALDAYQQALDIARDAGNEGGRATVLNNLGLLQTNLGNYPEALTALEEALVIVRDLHDRPKEGTTLLNLGGLYHAQGQADQALATYEQAADVVESVRAAAGTEANRAGFIAQFADLYTWAAGLYHTQGQDERALYTAERGRARAFLDSLATGYVELSDDEAAALWTAEQASYAARQAAQDALARARALDPPDPSLVADLEAQLANAEADYAAALEAIQARRDQLAALVPGRGTVLDLAGIQARLDSQTSLVSYYVLGDEGSLAFVITRDRFSTVELPDATPDNLGAALVALYQWPSLEEPHPQPLQDLHAWLLAPLADQLQTPLVGLIPHQLLHYVPFAALSDGQSIFGEQHILFALPSASTLPFIQDNVADTASTGALVFGNPETDEPGLRPLAFAARSAQSVAQLLGTTAYTGGQASEARLRGDATGVRVVHLSAHGGYNLAAPLYSSIYLAPGNDEDGRLEAHEVYGLDLQASDLVVLSACESLIAELSDAEQIAVSAGDELVGLTRAFFFAGTPTVIASLWSVDDAATEELMVAFYRHWQAGLGKAEALQAAQAELRQTQPSPYYWAAFVLSGDPGTVTGSTFPAEARPTPTPTGDEDGGLCPSLGAMAPLWLVGLLRARRLWRARRGPTSSP